MCACVHDMPVQLCVQIWNKHWVHDEFLTCTTVWWIEWLMAIYGLVSQKSSNFGAVNELVLGENPMILKSRHIFSMPCGDCASVHLRHLFCRFQFRLACICWPYTHIMLIFSSPVVHLSVAGIAAILCVHGHLLQLNLSINKSLCSLGLATLLTS